MESRAIRFFFFAKGCFLNDRKIRLQCFATQHGSTSLKNKKTYGIFKSRRSFRNARVKFYSRTTKLLPDRSSRKFFQTTRGEELKFREIPNSITQDNSLRNFGLNAVMSLKIFYAQTCFTDNIVRFISIVKKKKRSAQCKYDVQLFFLFFYH